MVGFEGYYDICWRNEEDDIYLWGNLGSIFIL